MSHGKKLYSLKGYRRQWASNTLWNDLAAYLVGGQAQLNTPVAATTLYIISTSAQDLTAGTGVDRVRILYLDATGHEHTVTASLNGTTAVSIGAGFTFIQFMESYHSTEANRVAAGAISITSTNGAAAEATTFEQIRAGGNRSQSCNYKVPTGQWMSCRQPSRSVGGVMPRSSCIVSFQADGRSWRSRSPFISAFSRR